MTQNSINNRASSFDADSITFDGGSNLLSEYEKGTFIPELAFGGSSSGIFYDKRSGVYTRIGRILVFHINLFLANKGSEVGSATITGLPYSTAAGPNQFNPLALWYNLTLGDTDRVPISFIGPLNNSINLQFTEESASTQDITNANFINSTQLSINGNIFL